MRDVDAEVDEGADVDDAVKLEPVLAAMQNEEDELAVDEERGSIKVDENVEEGLVADDDDEVRLVLADELDNVDELADVEGVSLKWRLKLTSVRESMSTLLT
eukprot:4969057-Amphidinium_carterae.1